MELEELLKELEKKDEKLYEMIIKYGIENIEFVPVIHNKDWEK